MFQQRQGVLLAPLAPFTTIVKVEPGTPGQKRVTMTIRWREGERDAKLTLLRVDTGGQQLW